MGRSVEFRPDPIDGCADARWLVGGEEREVNDSGELIVLLDDLENCRATDLQAALRRATRLCGDVYDPRPVVISRHDYLDKDAVTPEPILFELFEDHLTLFLLLGFDSSSEAGPQRLVRSVLDPLLRRHRMSIVHFKLQMGLGAPGSFVLYTLIGFNTRERTLRELYDIGQDARALFGAMRSGQLTRETAGDLIRGGHANVLIGQPEGHWLDVKSQHYDLRTDAGKIKIAQSVSRFCNAEDGGLVVVGMSTKRLPGGEEIRGLNPMPRDKGVVRRYQYAIERCLFPPPDRLSIESVDMPNDEMLILIYVPPQPEELKPFLVHGAVVDGQVEGAFISIVRRRGESSIPITAAMIHFHAGCWEGIAAAWRATPRPLGRAGGVAELYVIGDDFLTCLDRQVTGDAVRLEVVVLADDKPQKGANAFRLLDAQPSRALVGPDA